MAENRVLDMGRNHLLYGDCLDNLKLLGDDSVDLIYLDPPFKSDTDYNMLFGSETGEDTAQIRAFTDTWYWHAGHQEVYEQLQDRGGSVRRVSEAMFKILGPCGMLAYILFMTERLIELHRVLKQTGSLYLHCDPTASHYLKLVLDAVFGPINFGNEISWLRAQPKSHNTKNFSNSRDIILCYRASDKATFNKVYGDYNPTYIEKFYKHKDADGRSYRLDNLANPNKNRPNLTYEFLGVRRVWRWTKERMEKAYRDSLIVQSAPGKVPAFKRYLDEMPGQPITTNWDDIEHLHASTAEFLGYPTQKPLALLDRIVKAFSNEGDIILDPFCGCGTAVDAAQALGRRWIGMDVSALAINVIIARLEDVHGPNVMTGVDVTGIPTDVTAARMLFNKDPFDFERWAVGLIHARPNDRQTGDGGSDGELLFPSRGQGTI